MRRVSESLGYVHGIASLDEYRRRMREFRAQHARSLPPTVDQVVTGAAGVLEADGFVRVTCACGNWPLVDPVWALACCFRCGRVYESVVLPGDVA